MKSLTCFAPLCSAACCLLCTQSGGVVSVDAVEEAQSRSHEAELLSLVRRAWELDDDDRRAEVRATSSPVLLLHSVPHHFADSSPPLLPLTSFSLVPPPGVTHE